MEKRSKDLLRNLVTELRCTLLGTWDEVGNPVRGDLDRVIERLGVAPDGTLTPLDALVNPVPAERRARRVAEAQLASLPAEERSAARREIIERAGYTWVNRLLALRAMEARELIDETLRANPAYDGLSEALYILRQTQPDRASGADGGWWAVVEDACRAQSEALPGLFDLDDPNAALRPSTPALLSCVARVGGGLPGFTPEESDAAFADPDAIGWAYQFYQEEAKAQIDAKIKSGGKAESRAEIAAKTQLFTEPYMVQWLLQNSLGRTYHELYPDSKLPETWAYYIRPDELPPQRAVGEPGPSSLEELTFMDPCMGSGHFLREGFDMLAAMYRERYPGMGAREIADAVLSRHLHGIDIDPRAAQLAALTLYLRVWELVRDERRAQRLLGPGSYVPAALNLATTPTGLTPGALERHLDRHPEDRVFEPLLRGVFAALEQAPILGSLLQPREHLGEAIRAFRHQARGQFGLLPEYEALNRLLEELDAHDPRELQRLLMERVAHSFAAEATSADDVSATLFGRAAGEGLRLLQLLDNQYEVVATNPPYMGSGAMSEVTKRLVERHYTVGKSDFYAAFILRGLAFLEPGGRLAMITQQSWMFQRTLRRLRLADDETMGKQIRSGFKGILKTGSIETIAHLGPHAFDEISGEVVQTVMFTLTSTPPSDGHRIVAIRAVEPKTALGKAALLHQGASDMGAGFVFHPRQAAFSRIPEAPVIYWLTETLYVLLEKHSVPGPGDATSVHTSLSPHDTPRFVRYFWEVRDTALGRDYWWYTSGEGFRRWCGFKQRCVDWGLDGARLKRFIIENYPPEKFTLLIKRPETYGLPGCYYAASARGSLGVRLAEGAVFSDSAPGVSHTKLSRYTLAGVLSTRLCSFLVRALSGSPLTIRDPYVVRLPLHHDPLTDHAVDLIEKLVRAALALKEALVRLDPVEWTFDGLRPKEVGSTHLAQMLLCVTESVIEKAVFEAYQLDDASRSMILAETGVPAGWYPLITGYDGRPVELTPDLELPALPEEVPDYLATHDCISPSSDEFVVVRSNLGTLYEAGPGAREADLELEELEHHEEEVGTVSGAYVPIPSETFLEELSQSLKIHPLSTYWLLEDLRVEGMRCKPEEQRLLEDRLSVLILRLLGHRWPTQIEAGEPVPGWADTDGVIPLTAGTGETPLAERLRARLRAEEGPLGTQRTEALLQELTGQDLETWLQKSFFPRHVSQFKRRPIAWHLASTPRGRKKAGRMPAFECLLYYHACGGDVLARLRSHYLETLLRAERRGVEQARRDGDETAAAQATERIQELEEFASRLRQVEAEGFACQELEESMQNEPLDRWSGDGVFPPASRDELLTNEQAWHVDINDGVRVNIAPLQQAGLLASNVLNAKDMRKAIADRARWRSDERRWVREGMLPRCGWMDETVPESPRWTERAPEREAERQKLEEKRRALTEKLEGMQEMADELV